MAKRNNNLILIIDDDIDQLRQLGNLIKAQGDIIFATSAESGLFLAHERRPDLIITDLNLAGESGLDVCRRIKSQRLTQDCAVIIVHGENNGEDEVAALEAGAVDFISKPYHAPVVQARVRTHLSLARHKILLQELADRDGLTEVYNRRFLENQGRVELKRHYRQQQPMTLALLDIDHFKSYNDVYGHLQGDMCLREVAVTIATSSRRPGEFVARYGGEEFAVILPNTDVDNASKYGQWICEQIFALAIPHSGSSTVPFVTLSAGIATVTPSASTTLENLIATADTALYKAKEEGRNQFRVACLDRESIREVG